MGSGRHSLGRLGQMVVAAMLLLGACAPAAGPTPTAAPAKPAPTTAPAKPAATTPAASAASPVAQPAASPAAKTAASPAAGPTGPIEKPGAAPGTQPAAKSAAALRLSESELRSVEEFYRDKTFTIVVGFSAGGGYDTYSRLLSRYLGNYIPGNPNVIVENRTGAGSLIAANYTYNLAPKDGTQMGMFDEYLVLGQLAGKPGIEFDAREFNWVGNPAVDPPVCVFRSDLGYDSFQELLESGREVVMGATGTGSQPYATPAAIQAVTGANFRIVTGYEGTSRIRLAVQNQEVDGACWGWSSVKTTAAEWFEGDQPFAKVLVQTGATRHPDLPEVPLAREFVRNPDNIFLFDILDAAAEFTRPYALPPDVPEARVKAIRSAYIQAFNDPAAMAEAERSQLILDPQDYATVQRAVQTIFATAPEQVEEAANTLGLR